MFFCVPGFYPKSRLYLLVKSLSGPLDCDSLFHIFLVFDVLEGFKEHRWGVLYKVLQIGLLWCFSHDSIDVVSLGEEDYRGEMTSPSLHQGYVYHWY